MDNDPQNNPDTATPGEEHTPGQHDQHDPNEPTLASIRKRKKKNFLLWESFGISAAIQIGLLILAGGYVVYDTVLREDTQFEEPPPEEVVELPQNVEAQIQKQPPRMNLQQRPLKIKSVGNISVANVTADVVAGAGESFTIGGGEVSGMGNLDIGEGAGQLGLGMSEINVFGIEDKGERILFLVDASERMLYDDMGGLWSYQAIKDEIVRLVGGLAPGALFNVIIFHGQNGRAQALSEDLLAATPENVEKLKKWIEPINQDVAVAGRIRPNIKPEKFTDTPVGAALADPAYSWGNGRMMITQIALEQNVDLVYIITSEWGGFQRIRRSPTEEEKAAWERKTSDPQYQRQLKAHLEEVAELDKRLEQRKKQIDAQRKQKGLPPRVWPGRAQLFKEFNIKVQNEHPGYEPTYFIEQRDVENYFKAVVDELYRKQNLTEPRINVIIFMAEDAELERETVQELRGFTRFFRNGRYRELKGRAAIESFQQGQN